MQLEGYFTEEEMAKVLRISVGTLRCRRSRGSNHPPYVSLRRGVVVYPKELFLRWVADKPVIWEVKSAS